jgi:iron complex transport system substrate-binding protein
MNVQKHLLSGSLLLFLCLIAGCGQEKQQHSEDTLTQSLKNTYAEKVTIHHAKGFTVDYFDHFKVVKIVSPSLGDTACYLLVERGTVKPQGFPDHQTIEIPIRSLAAMSSTHVGLVGFLDAYPILKGLGSLQYVYASEVNAMIDRGAIEEVGREQGINEEKIIAMDPDLVMATGNPGAKSPHYQTLSAAEIPVMFNSEWIETTPLARAEWVKLLAALLNKETEVNRKFEAVEKEYARLIKLAATSTGKPSILCGLNTKDVWFLPGADSYMTRFFEDAGTTYHWADSKTTGTLSLSFEAVYPYALHTDYWMNVGFDKNDTKKTILSMDERYADFSAFKKGNVFSYNNRVNTKGSNDFFESGNVSPQTVLADLIHIFHPELLPAHQLVYYKKLD